MPQNASYNSVMISIRVRGVNSYLREPGIVSKANLRRDNGSDDRSRLLMLSNLEGRNDEKVDIATSGLWWDFKGTVGVRVEDKSRLVR